MFLHGAVRHNICDNAMDLLAQGWVPGSAERAALCTDGSQRACLEARRPHVVVVGRPAGALQGQLNRMVGGQRCDMGVVFAHCINMGKPGKARCLAVPGVAVTLHTRPSSIVNRLTCHTGMTSRRRAEAWLGPHLVLACLWASHRLPPQGPGDAGAGSHADPSITFRHSWAVLSVRCG